MSTLVELQERRQKRLRSLKRRKREAQFGLANNTAGAAAGAVGSVTAYKVIPKTEQALNATKTGRFLKRRHINPRVAIPLAGTALVGSQVVNAGLDAQSAAYFTREVKRLGDKERRMEARLSKSYESVFPYVEVPTSESGTSLEVSKAKRRYNPEDERFRRLGIYEGIGFAGGAGALGASAYKTRKLVAPKWNKWYAGAVGNEKGAAKLKAAGKKLGPAKVPAGLAATGAAMTGLGVVAHRRATQERNARWY